MNICANTKCGKPTKNPRCCSKKCAGEMSGYRFGKPTDEVLVMNSKFPRDRLKKRIMDEKLLPYECQCCGLGAEWQGKPMILILDHINGINNDNRIENLRFICSNCDSQLPTYKNRNQHKLKKPR